MMWRKMGYVLLVFFLGMGIVVAALSLISSQASAASQNSAWAQVNEDGFGAAANGQIPSLAVFEGYLYAGTQNYSYDPADAEIWRSPDGSDWQLVDEREANGAAALIPFDGYLYSGSWDGKVWRSDDGLTWTEVITDGFGDSANGIARFAVFNDMLYAGTWNGNSATEIWRTSDGLDWDQFGVDGLAPGSLNGGAIASEVFEGYLYWGIGNWINGAQLWRTDGITLTQIITGGFGMTQTASFSSLCAFKGYLYAGMWNPDHVQVWRSDDGLAWSQVGAGVIGLPGAAMQNSLEVYNGKLYLAVQNEITGVEVWRTANGVDWEQIGFAGFGDVNNINPYWDSGTLVFNEELYFSITNFVTGGEVWRLSQPWLKVYLPYMGKDLDLDQ